jgi:hypothetical protein
MGWVVKQWRVDALERLLADEARDAVRAARAAAERDARRAREAAERDARRARRAADRTAAEAARELEALERLAEDLRATVRRRRVALRSPVPGAAPRVVAAAGRTRRRRRERASLHGSGITELFRATGAR